MADNKKSFVLYCDIIKTVEKLPNETAGELFKHLLSYVNDEEPETDNLLVEVAFEPIKQQLKRDLVKWEERAERSRENGKKGGRPKQKNLEKPKKPSGFINNLNEPEKPVNDTVNVTVNVNVNDIEYIYSLYPSKCPIQSRSLGKNSKNKKQIEKHLKTKTKEELEIIINSYIEDCKKNNVYFKNFSVLLNNLPEIEETVFFKTDFDSDGVYRELSKNDFDKQYSNYLDRVTIFDKKPIYASLIKS